MPDALMTGNKGGARINAYKENVKIGATEGVDVFFDVVGRHITFWRGKSLGFLVAFHGLGGVLIVAIPIGLAFLVGAAGGSKSPSNSIAGNVAFFGGKALNQTGTQLVGFSGAAIQQMGIGGYQPVGFNPILPGGLNSFTPAMIGLQQQQQQQQQVVWKP